MELQLSRPDDWHVHLRDGPSMGSVVAHTAERFNRALVMPNLTPPVVTTAQALDYRARIMAAASKAGLSFDPRMALYLTDVTSPEEVPAAKGSGVVAGFKLYPAGATTNSAYGVTDVRKVYPVLAEMERAGVPLQIHGEVTATEVDVFDREAVFVEQILAPLINAFPGLRIVLEHITTKFAVDFVTAGSDHLAATITAHHLLENRNAMFKGGIRPHYYCLPVLKRERDRLALVAAATSGNKKFFLGTDSAPHSIAAKQSACGCAGVYTSHAALELYAEAFDQAGALAALEGFASHFGADFYGLGRNEEQVRLVRAPWSVPADYTFGGDRLQPYRAGEVCMWTLSRCTS